MRRKALMYIVMIFSLASFIVDAPPIKSKDEPQPHHDLNTTGNFTETTNNSIPDCDEAPTKKDESHYKILLENAFKIAEYTSNIAIKVAEYSTMCAWGIAFLPILFKINSLWDFFKGKRAQYLRWLGSTKAEMQAVTGTANVKRPNTGDDSNHEQETKALAFSSLFDFIFKRKRAPYSPCQGSTDCRSKNGDDEQEPKETKELEFSLEHIKNDKAKETQFNFAVLSLLKEAIKENPAPKTALHRMNVVLERDKADPYDVVKELIPMMYEPKFNLGFLFPSYKCIIEKLGEDIINMKPYTLQKADDQCSSSTQETGIVPDRTACNLDARDASYQAEDDPTIEHPEDAYNLPIDVQKIANKKPCTLQKTDD